MNMHPTLMKTSCYLPLLVVQLEGPKNEEFGLRLKILVVKSVFSNVQDVGSQGIPEELAGLQLTPWGNPNACILSTFAF
jgi:hypothetical protein